MEEIDVLEKSTCRPGIPNVDYTATRMEGLPRRSGASTFYSLISMFSGWVNHTPPIIDTSEGNSSVTSKFKDVKLCSGLEVKMD